MMKRAWVGSRGRGPVVIAVLAASALAVRPAAAQKVTLKWKYDAGSELVYRMKNHQDTSMDMAGESSSDQTQTMRWKVTEVAPNGDATISMTTERVQVEMHGMTGDLKYDSESGEVPTDPQLQQIAALADMSYTVVVGPDGSVKSIQGLDELREKMRASMPQLAMVESMTGELFSEESLTRMAQQNVQMFPADAVGRGDTWDRSFTMPVPMLGSMTTKMTFTLQGTEQSAGRTIAKIGTTGTITMGGEPNAQVPMTVDLGDTKLSGSMDFDVDRGVTVSSTTKTSMQMNIGVAGQSMSMTMSQTSTLELVEFKAGH